MRKKQYVVRLSAAQRWELEALVRSGRESARKIRRARVLLEADQLGDGFSDDDVGEAADAGRATVERVRRRFCRDGLSAALEDRPSPERPELRALDGAAEAQLTMLACSSPPAGRGGWTLRLLADRMVELKFVPAVSHETVRRTLKKTSSSRG